MRGSVQADASQKLFKLYFAIYLNTTYPISSCLVREAQRLGPRTEAQVQEVRTRGVSPLVADMVEA